MAKVTPKWFTHCVLITLLVLPIVTSAPDVLNTLLGGVEGVVGTLLKVDVERLITLLNGLRTVSPAVSDTLSEVKKLLKSITSDNFTEVINTILTEVLALLTTISVPETVLPALLDIIENLTTLLRNQSKTL